MKRARSRRRARGIRQVYEMEDFGDRSRPNCAQSSDCAELSDADARHHRCGLADRSARLTPDRAFSRRRIAEELAGDALVAALEQ